MSESATVVRQLATALSNQKGDKSLEQMVSSPFNSRLAEAYSTRERDNSADTDIERREIPPLETKPASWQSVDAAIYCLWNEFETID